MVQLGFCTLRCGAAWWPDKGNGSAVLCLLRCSLPYPYYGAPVLRRAQNLTYRKWGKHKYMYIFWKHIQYPPKNIGNTRILEAPAPETYWTRASLLTWRAADCCNDIETKLRLETEGADWHECPGANGCLPAWANECRSLNLWSREHVLCRSSFADREPKIVETGYKDMSRLGGYRLHSRRRHGICQIPDTHTRIW